MSIVDILLRFLIPIIISFTLYLKYKKYILNKSFKLSAIYYIAFFYFILLSSLKFFKFYNSNYDYFDFGFYLHKIYYCNFYNVENLCTAGHFQPIIFLLNLFSYFQLYPYILLVLGSLVVSLSGIILSYTTFNILKSEKLSLIIGVSYFVFPVTSFIDILGLHPDIFVIFFCTIALFFMSIKRYFLSYISFSLVVLCGEQWLFSFIFFSIYLFFINRNLIYIFLLCISILISFLVFKYLSVNASEHNLTAVTSSAGPYSSLVNFDLEKILFDNLPKKIYFIFFICLPFLFLFNNIFFILIPDFSKILLSTELLHFLVDSHYTVVILPVIFFSYAVRIKNIISRLNLVIISFFIFVSLSISNSALPISINFYTNYAASNYNFKNYFYKKNELSDIRLMLDYSDDIVIVNKAFHKDFYKFKNLSRFTNLDNYIGKYFIFNNNQHLSDGATYSESDFNIKINEALFFLKNNCHIKYNNNGYLLFKC